MKKILFFALLTFVWHPFVIAQHPLLHSGPMLGYSEMKEVMIWVQTKQPAKVKVRYWDSIPSRAHWTAEVQTEKESAFTAHLVADEVEPGRTYTYELYVGGKKLTFPYPMHFKSRALWEYRTDPPSAKVALGSCTFINEEQYDRNGKPYGGDYQIFEQIHAQQPDLMLWLGDNIYLREVDFDTRTGILHRYTHGRAIPEMQPLLANTHHYAIWDDHDYGPNDADASYIHKDKTLEAFRLFWGNPTYGNSELGGTTTQFSWAGMDFFLLDNRWFRSQNERVTGERQILGKTQVEWLISALKNSQAPFKFVAVGGQVLNDFDKYENHIHIAPEERQYLLDAIQKEKIKGVIFLTGDRHHTELSKYTGQSGPAIWDFTVSPLTSTAYESESEPNSLRVPGSQYGKRNFAIMEIKGPKKARELILTVFDLEGKPVWTHTLLESEL